MSSSNFMLGSSGSAPHNGAFISGSNGNLEISSSKFHLQPGGDTIMQGKITAESGLIGGWTIKDKYLLAKPGTVAIIGSGSSAGQINVGWKGSVLDGDPSYQNVINPNFKTSGEGVVLSGSGFFRAGNPVGERIEYEPATKAGNTSRLILSASSFLLGSPSQFVSGSLGNVEISSSNFHLSNTGNVVMSGQVTATSGEIGGFLISQNEISSSATPKRGLVLKPGDSIRGFGSTVHSTRGTGGKFSFGAGQAVAPAAGAGTSTFDPSQTQAPGGSSFL